MSISLDERCYFNFRPTDYHTCLLRTGHDRLMPTVDRKDSSRRRPPGCYRSSNGLPESFACAYSRRGHL